jgi:hypothetical protein
MSKGKHGNKEAKKPKQAPQVLAPAVPVVAASLPGRPTPAQRPGKR